MESCSLPFSIPSSSAYYPEKTRFVWPGKKEENMQVHAKARICGLSNRIYAGEILFVLFQMDKT